MILIKRRRAKMMRSLKIGFSLDGSPVTLVSTLPSPLLNLGVNTSHFNGESIKYVDFYEG
jgi:hypothetical protein